MIIAIVPAKQFSRRLPYKNIKKFFGKPMILWTISILKKTKLFKKIYVSTDSKSINELLKKKKDIEIIKRPNFLCTNKITTLQVIKHAIEYLKNKKIYPKYICCMYPAAPNTDYNKIIYAYNTLRKDKNKNKFIFPVVPKSNLKDHSLPPVIVKKNNRDTVNEYFFDAGQFYFAKTKVWIISKKIIKNGSKVIKLKKNESIDINTYQNFLEAKKIFKQVNKFS